MTLFRRNGELSGFVCEGHADWAQEGDDIVCAAVSVLTINTCNSIEAFASDQFTVDAAEDGGYLKLQMNDTVSPEASLLLKSLELGLQTISQTYGDEFLRISYSDL